MAVLGGNVGVFAEETINLAATFDAHATVAGGAAVGAEAVGVGAMITVAYGGVILGLYGGFSHD
jgi:hypothetical protein